MRLPTILPARSMRFMRSAGRSSFSFFDRRRFRGPQTVPKYRLAIRARTVVSGYDSDLAGDDLILCVHPYFQNHRPFRGQDGPQGSSRLAKQVFGPDICSLGDHCGGNCHTDHGIKKESWFQSSRPAQRRAPSPAAQTSPLQEPRQGMMLRRGKIRPGVSFGILFGGGLRMMELAVHGGSRGWIILPRATGLPEGKFQNGAVKK
jgi:hypothetical protein